MGAIRSAGWWEAVAVSSTLRRDELPRDAVVLHVLDQIAREPDLPVREWLLFLALTAADDVAGRLEGAGAGVATLASANGEECAAR